MRLGDTRLGCETRPAGVWQVDMGEQGRARPGFGTWGVRASGGGVPATRTETRRKRTDEKESESERGRQATEGVRTADSLPETQCVPKKQQTDETKVR